MAESSRMDGGGVIDWWGSSRQSEENGHNCEDGKVKDLFEE